MHWQLQIIIQKVSAEEEVCAARDLAAANHHTEDVSPDTLSAMTITNFKHTTTQVSCHQLQA